MTFIVGLDPGKNGALALYSTMGREIHGVWPIPTLTVTKKQKSSTDIDWEAYCKALQGIRLTGPSLAVVELVHAMPGQGVSTMFSFGDNYGGQRQLLRYILGCRVERVAPHIWKRAMKIGADKDDAYREAQNRWPALALSWKTPRGRVLDGNCEAALLAAYGHQLLEAGK